MSLTKTKLGDIAEIVAGQSPESKFYSNDNGTPFLQGNRTFGLKYPEIDTYTQKVTKLAKAKSILMSVRAPVGDMNIASCDVCIGRGLASINAIDSSNEYLYYNLKNSISNLTRRSNGTTYDSITAEVLLDYDMYIHESLDDRSRIANVLTLLDAKIELNRQINDNLEAMAKQLYDYWFVQFDFPNEEGKPYKSSGGKMVWNEKLKREIPEGWKDGVFSDIANITMGQSPDGSSYNEEGKGEIFYQGSTDFGIRFPSVRMYTTAPTRFAKQGDILMSVRAPVGAVNIANTDCCIGRGLSAINSKIGSTTYTYFVIHYLKVRFDSMNSAGTTFGSITKEELYSLPVVIPTDKVIKIFESVSKPIFDKQMAIGHEMQNLTKQRDELLPLLMNGQVSVNYHLSDD